MSTTPKDELHGITLEKIVTDLHGYYGWQELGRQVDIRCFQQDPSIGSSLKFLRRTPWARAKVERLSLFMCREQARATRRPRPRARPSAAMPARTGIAARAAPGYARRSTPVVFSGNNLVLSAV